MTLAGPQQPRHIIQGNSLHLSPGEGGWGSKDWGGESFDSLGERGGISRSQQGVKGEYGNFIANLLSREVVVVVVWGGGGGS